MTLLSKYGFDNSNGNDDSGNGRTIAPFLGVITYPTGHTLFGVSSDGHWSMGGAVGSVSEAGTVMAWIKMPDVVPAADETISVMVASDADGLGFVCYRGPSGTQIDVEAGSTVFPLTPTTEAWHHIAVVLGGSTVYLYVDGVLANSATESMSFTAANAFVLLEGSVAGFIVDDLRIYSHALSGAEIVADRDTPVVPNVIPDPSAYSQWTNSDLELRYLTSVRGSTRTTLADARNDIYGPNAHSYFAALSGLTPSYRYSLSDHKLAYYRAITGVNDRSLSDTARLYWADQII